MLTEKERKRISNFIQCKFPDRIAVLIYPLNGPPQLEKEKFVVSKDTSYVHFLAEVRKYCKTGKSLFFFSEKKRTAPLMSLSMADVVKEHEGEGSVLCLLYTEEHIFG